jgi:serine protease Do
MTTTHRTLVAVALALGVLTCVVTEHAVAVGPVHARAAAAARALPVEAVAPPAIPARLWSEVQPADTGLSAETPVTMGAFSRLAKVISPAVVNIVVTRLRRDGVQPAEVDAGEVVTASGTGFFVHQDGWVLTNHHVVEGVVKIQVKTADDRTFGAHVAGLDPYTDLALLRVDKAGPFPTAPLGDSDALDIGEWVVAVGNPYGLGHTVTAGIVSAKGRSTILPGQTRYASYIQTDASINPGNSGGPLVNIHGQVVGINAASLGKAQGIGFAIPSNMAKKLLPQLARGKIERSWLGVSVAEVTAQVARALRLDRTTGALVREVVAGGPAAQAGLRAGDVILRFGDHEIRNANDLPWLAASEGVGKRVRVEAVRDGQPLRAEVVLTTMPQQFGAKSGAKASAPTPKGEVEIAGLGFRVVALDAAVRRRYRLAADKGALVVHVDRGGPADLVGIRVGDVVVQAERRAIRDAGDLVKVNAWFPATEIVPLYVARGRQLLFVMPKKGR